MEGAEGEGGQEGCCGGGLGGFVCLCAVLGLWFCRCLCLCVSLFVCVLAFEDKSNILHTVPLCLIGGPRMRFSSSRRLIITLRSFLGRAMLSTSMSHFFTIMINNAAIISSQRVSNAADCHSQPITVSIEWQSRLTPLHAETAPRNIANIHPSIDPPGNARTHTAICTCTSYQLSSFVE